MISLCTRNNLENNNDDATIELLIEHERIHRIPHTHSFRSYCCFNSPMSNSNTDIDITVQSTVSVSKESDASHSVKNASQDVQSSANEPSSSDETTLNSKSSSFMSTESIGKIMWKLTYPSLIAKLTSALYAVCDSMFIGQLAGETSEERSISLSAVSLAMPIEQGIVHSLAMMVSQGGSTLYGQSIGEKNTEKGKRVIGNTYSLEILMFLIMACIFSFLCKPILKLIGATDEAGTLTPGMEYANTLLIGSICYNFYISSADLTRGQGSALFSCLLSITSAICNIIGDPIFIKLFHLKIMGASVSTVIASGISGVIGFIFMRSKNAAIRWSFKDMIPDWKLCGRILITGMSGLVSGFSGAFVTIVSNLLVIKYSEYPVEDIHTTTVVGAWGTLGRVYFISFMPLIALAQGVLPMLAFSSGAKLNKRFIACAKLTLYWMFGITAVVEIVLLIFARQIGLIFSDEPLFLEFFVPALRIMVSGVILQPFVMGLFPVLQAVGKGGLAGMLLALKTCVVLLIFQFGISAIMGSYWGAVYAYPLTEVVSTIIAIIIYCKNKKYFYGTQELPVVIQDK